MTNLQFITLIGMLAGGFGWIMYQISSIGNKVSGLDSRIASLEAKMASIEIRMTSTEASLRDIVNYLLGKKIGTDHK